MPEDDKTFSEISGNSPIVSIVNFGNKLIVATNKLIVATTHSIYEIVEGGRVVELRFQEASEDFDAHRRA